MDLPFFQHRGAPLPNRTTQKNMWYEGLLVVVLSVLCVLWMPMMLYYVARNHVYTAPCPRSFTHQHPKFLSKQGFNTNIFRQESGRFSNYMICDLNLQENRQGRNNNNLLPRDALIWPLVFIPGVVRFSDFISDPKPGLCNKSVYQNINNNGAQHHESCWYTIMHHTDQRCVFNFFLND